MRGKPLFILVVGMWIVASEGLPAQGPGSDSQKADTGQSETVEKDDTTPPWEARAIAGFHQAGAASADSTQHFFLDFFIMRGLGKEDTVWESPVNLWGNVRVASVPQQVNGSVAEFASNFATEFGKVPVNELAQGAEFQAGLEYNVKTFGDRRKRMLGLIGFYGASGVFQPAAAQLSVFRAPVPGDAQFPEFERQVLNKSPEARGREFVGFVPPERDQFFRMWGFGFRVTTFDLDKPYEPPATFAFTIGRDEAITGGRYESAVGRFDVFYPLPFHHEDGKYSFVYLFGTANLRLFDRTQQRTPLILEGMTLVDSPNPAAPKEIAPFDPRIAIVPSPSNRDTYRLGVGIDLAAVIRAWRAPKAPAPGENAAPAEKAPGP